MKTRDGILLLDKPSGMTSNKALHRVKKALSQRKAGHGGSLDPLAAGVLPILLGDYTKLADVFLGATKEYETQWTLGATTDTGDSEGKQTHKADIDACALSEQTIRDVLARFQGEIMQRPPSYSAIKFKGKPLYKYARAGRPIQAQERSVYIHFLELLDFSPPYVSVAIKCSKGVYVRSLAVDFGAALGCGAYVSKLRRTRVGDFPIAQMATLSQLEEASSPASFLLPVSEICRLVPNVFISSDEKKLFAHGKEFPCQSEVRNLTSGGRVCVFMQQDFEGDGAAGEQVLLLGLADLRDGYICPRRVCSGGIIQNPV